MIKEEDKEILRLEYLYKIGAKPAESEKKDKTIKLSKAVHSRIGLYSGKVSSMIEEDLIKRLRADGHLPPPLDGDTFESGVPKELTVSGSESFDFNGNLAWLEEEAEKDKAAKRGKPKAKK